ncbi:hypothetical protein ALC152_13820 [Arcobacter sp. 15-2]|uniref:FxsA family protein n=1 Tax=Arcobacter sp. 15-2 TaxID=3374109 RepID=UPI00399C8EBF
MIYFFIYLFLEVMISSSISGQIGGLNTFFEIIITAIIGIIILKNFKVSLMESISKARVGQITQEEFINTNVGKAMGAVLLIVPGFFTDFLGLLMQFSFLVVIMSKIFKFKTPRQRTTYTTNFSSSDFGYDTSRFTNANTKNTNNTNYKRNKDEIIDVEVIDDNNTLKH